MDNQPTLHRGITIPDGLRIARCVKAPEYGPRILFFSGGSALNDLSRLIVHYTHNSIHIITPFDSGGSSAKLRDAFNVMGVGDFRSRLLALADQSVKGQQEVYTLLSHRLPVDKKQDELRDLLSNIVNGHDDLIINVPDPLRKLIRNHLQCFVDRMPSTIDLRGASIGNLMLVGGYFNNAQDMEAMIFLFSKLVEARGRVRPVVEDNLHLAVELENGEHVYGQHLITGKEVSPITSQVKRLFLISRIDNPTPVRTTIHEKITRLIEKADLICYPMGSFYTSLLANFLPGGVGTSIATNSCPKVYIPNLGSDPEQIGLSIPDQVQKISEYLQQSAGSNVALDKILNLVCIDRDHHRISDQEMSQLKNMGLTVIDHTFVESDKPEIISPKLCIESLLSLV